MPVEMSHPITSIDQSELTVLVVNSSQEMAKEMTMQLTLEMPGCSITFAPTISIAKWILARKKIDLIVSSPVLPDGSVTKLKECLEKMETPPDVVIVGDVRLKNTEIFANSSYHVATVKRFNSNEPTFPKILRKVPLQKDRIKSLGADIRNDLNNPLQEIVAMVFVAKASGEVSSGTSQALLAIEGAAKNMASVVKSLEDKIRCAVG